MTNLIQCGSLIYCGNKSIVTGKGASNSRRRLRPPLVIILGSDYDDQGSRVRQRRNK